MTEVNIAPKTPARNIVLICHSDLLGGAAIATYRLMKALQGQGVKASMLVVNKLSNDPDVHILGTIAGLKFRFLAERGYIFTHNGFNRRDLFKVSVANTGFDIAHHPLVTETDAVILSWINQGMVSLSGIDRLLATGKRVLWVMHDMWCMTGICHHALMCTNFENQCGDCMYLHGCKSPHDLSRKVWAKKNVLYKKYPALTMIAVSSWVEEKARQSSLLAHHDERLISNPFPCEEFYTRPRGFHIPESIDTSRRLIVMGAARLDDPIKDLPLAIDALNDLATSRPDIAATSQVVFYGNLRAPEMLERLSFPHTWVGSVTDPQELAEIFSRAAVVLSTSRFETLGITLMEGVASGCKAVSTADGGQRDIITDGVNGFLTDHTPRSVSMALAKALDTPCDRESQRLSVTSRFSAPRIARLFLDII